MQIVKCTFFSLFLWTSSLLAMPQEVILLRHAEKPATGDTLSVIGFQRAEALVGYFSDPNLPFQLETPVAIYAQRSDKGHRSTRPVQTVGPLANAWQVPLYTTYSSKKYEGMVDEVTKRYTKGLVLISWSHDSLQDIAKEFGVKNPPLWPDNAYDWVWVLRFNGDKLFSFQQFIQASV